MQETKVNTGGPAFPIHWENHHQGITMRDYFAAKAMQSYLSRISSQHQIAKLSYSMADAMLKARSN